MEDLYGRVKITIPVSKEKFDINPLKYIEHYLLDCSTKNEKNKQDCEKLNNIYLGKQDILNKTRFNFDTENNNILVANHHFRQVEFKKGFTVGNPIDYSLREADEKDVGKELAQLKTYLTDEDKAEKDIDKYEDLYKCGMALQFLIPKRRDFEYGKEAPFELMNVELGTAFVVYSNDIASDQLFNVVISSEIDEEFVSRKVYYVYYINNNDSGYCYLAKYKNGTIASVPERVAISNEKQPYKFLPLIEYALNKNRIGVVELVLLIGNALNLLQSNQLDDIIDFVNSYIIFENVDPKFVLSNIEEFRKKKTIAIKSNNPATPAKVSSLKQTLSHAEVNQLFDILKREMYDITATPQSSGEVSSGGDTGEARILGNGWESAQNQAKVDTLYIAQFERKLLKYMILICKDDTKNNISSLSASDISIKYDINMSNNILTKTQALQNLDSVGMPHEESLKMTGLTNDTNGVADKWQANLDAKEQKALQLAQANAQNQNNNNNENEPKEE